MKDKKSKIQLIIIILELIILIGISGYRVYEYVIKDKEEIKENENANENIKKCKVAFDYGNNSIISIEVKENEKIELPDEPIKEGYKFGGWLNDYTLIDENYIVKEDITLKINWIDESINSGIKILVYQINIRKEANEESEDIGDVLLDETYEVLEVIDSNNYTWYKIKKGNIIGYVANQKGENWVDYNDNKIEELDINSDLIKSLIFPLQEKSLSCNFTPFSEQLRNIMKNDFNVFNADNEQLLEVLLYYYFSDWNRKEIPVEEIDGIYYSILKKDILNSYYKNLYGPDVIFEPQTINSMIYSIQKEQYSWKTHYGIGITCGPTAPHYLHLSAKKAKKINDEIIVYYNIYEIFNGKKHDENSDVKILVKDYINDTEIASKTCNSIMKEHGIETCSSEDENNFVAELSKQNKLPIYIATFKKQSDGNYYFTKGEWQ